MLGQISRIQAALKESSAKVEKAERGSEESDSGRKASSGSERLGVARKT